MAGTKAGGAKARDTNIKRHGKDFYVKLGAKGGKVGKTGGFASMKVGRDGLTGQQRASVAGRKGGKWTKYGLKKPTRKIEVKFL